MLSGPGALWWFMFFSNFRNPSSVTLKSSDIRVWARSKVWSAGGVRSGKNRRELFVQEAGFADFVNMKLAITEK